VKRFLRPTLALALAAVFLLAACGGRAADAETAAAEWDGAARASGQVAYEKACAFAALGSKTPGTEETRRAAEWIADELAASGVAVSVDEFRDATPFGEKTFRNVCGTIPAAGASETGKIVVLGAHYDTKGGIPGFVGANDSASGVGALLALAPALAEARLPFETRLLFFDGEECAVRYGEHDGLHGSKRAAAELVRKGEAAAVSAMILLDMIGDRDLRVTLERGGDGDLARRILRAAGKEGVREKFALAPAGFSILDDHVPFRRAGIPCADLIDFTYGGEDNPFWHTSEDTTDKISAESLGAVVRVVERVLRDAASAATKRP